MHKNSGDAASAASPRGLAILVLLLCFGFNFIGRGVADTYMVFLLPLGAEFGWHRSQMTSVYSLLMVVSGLASPLAGMQGGLELVCTTGGGMKLVATNSGHGRFTIREFHQLITG